MSDLSLNLTQQLKSHGKGSGNVSQLFKSAQSLKGTVEELRFSENDTHKQIAGIINGELQLVLESVEKERKVWNRREQKVTEILRRVTEDRKKQKSRLQKAEQDVEDITGKMRRAENRISELESQVKIHKQNYIELEASHNETLREMQSLASENADQTSEMLRLETAKKGLDEVLAERDAFRDEALTLKRQMVENQGKIAEYRIIVEDRDRHKFEAERLRKLLFDAEEQVRLQQNSHNAGQEGIKKAAALEPEIEDLKLEVQRLKYENTSLQEARQNSEAHSGRLQAQMEDVMQNWRNDQILVENLRKERDILAEQLQADKVAHSQTIAEEQASMFVLRNELQFIKANNQKLQDQELAARSQLDMEKRRTSKAEEEIDRLRLRLVGAEAEVQAQRSTQERGEKRINELEHKLKDLVTSAKRQSEAAREVFKASGAEQPREPETMTFDPSDSLAREIMGPPLPEGPLLPSRPPPPPPPRDSSIRSAALGSPTRSRESVTFDRQLDRRLEGLSHELAALKVTLAKENPRAATQPVPSHTTSQTGRVYNGYGSLPINVNAENDRLRAELSEMKGYVKRLAKSQDRMRRKMHLMGTQRMLNQV
eukprot:Clim_evm80s128 gene=Clim_evmTU80s128